MEKAERARARLYKPAEGVRSPRVSETAQTAGIRDAKSASGPEMQASRPASRTDLLELVLEAGNRGMPASFLGKLESRVSDRNATATELAEIERKVRYWLLHRANPITNLPRPAQVSPADVNATHQ